MTIASVLVVALISLTAAAQTKTAEWIPMFDGKTLQDWKETAFDGHGTVRPEKGAIVMNAGAPMTGINYTGSFPKLNYEIRFEASREAGGDFFASLTFPVGDSFATFVTGGWGGDIVGISSIDGWDASDNETRTYYTFETHRWYAFRLRVQEGNISAWIDEKPVVNLNINGRPISLRHGDIKLSAPLGFASYNTTGSLRKIEYRLLKPPAANH